MGGAATPVSYDSAREDSQMNERYTFTQAETRQLTEIQDLADAVEEDKVISQISNRERPWGPQPGTTSTDRSPPEHAGSSAQSPRASAAVPSTKRRKSKERGTRGRVGSSAHTLEGGADSAEHPPQI